MRLHELTAGLVRADASSQAVGDDVAITGLAYDSRSVRPGYLFFCVPGFRSDGHEFAAQALQRGAAALVVERRLGLAAPEAVVASTRAAMAPIAARFFGDPTAHLSVIGVTGTNGKTTTAYLVRALLEAQAIRCGLLGTVTSIVGGAQRPVERTTPEAVDLQSDFRAMLDGGDRACAMEVSSHALELGRAQAIHFAVAVFTNLSRDHLDFHPTMEDYFQAKRRLFTAAAAPGAGKPPRASIINVGDPYGRRLAEEITHARTFAVELAADYSAQELRCGLGGCSFTLCAGARRLPVALPLPGRFNVANALAALAAAHALGGDLDELAATLERGVRVPGRFEPVEEGQDFAVLVDYAHTPDSLRNVLQAARELIDSEDAGGGRVVCVFGAGGDRDRGKRPLMGEIGARLADLAIVTSDNPRSEDPELIISEVMAGAAAADGTSVQRIADRAKAIERSIELAGSGDVVVIAGKGHEQGQELANGRKIPFDDVAVARAALRAASTGRRRPHSAGHRPGRPSGAAA